MLIYQYNFFCLSEIKYLNPFYFCLFISFFISLFILEKCPGVCVAERLSGFCEAILDVPGICSSNMKCCVSKQIFEGENVPAGLIIPPSRNTNSNQNTPEKPEVTTTSTPRSPATAKPKQTSSDQGN